MRRDHIFLVCIVFCLIFTSSCKPEYIYNKTIKIQNSTWSFTDSLNFDFSISDTSKYYDLFLNLKHSPDYAGQNLYSRIYTTFPDGTNAVDTISLELTNKMGSWLGKCNSSSCDLDLLLKSKTRFQNIGDYKIKLEQYNRMDSLSGVHSVSFMIAEVAQ